MRKFIFYTLWTCNKLEKYLENMESTGLRLSRFSFTYWFDFVESKPKHVHYFYSTSFIKDVEMLEDEYQVRKKYDAKPIPSISSGLNHIHRFSRTKIDIDELRRIRNNIPRRIILKKSVVYIIALMGVVCGYFLYDRTNWLFFPFIILFACLSLFYMYGFLVLYRNDKTGRNRTD